jgi:hypothetical protein
VSSSVRIVVTGLIAQHPRLGGITWHYLQFVLGLARLGHDVYYVEDSGEFPYNLDGGASGDDWNAPDCSENVGHLAGVMARFGLERRWAYRDAPRGQWYGLPDAQRRAVLESAELLLNVSGTLEHPERYRSIPRLVYIDTDPVVTQVKIATARASFVKRVAVHDVHFSFGERLGDPVPDTGHRWRPTRQPIVLSEWQPQTPARDVFTTVMNWTSYAPLRHAGRAYGQKDVEFKRFLELARDVAPIPLEVALSRTQHLEWEAEARDLPPDLRDRLRDRPDWTPRDLVRHAGFRVVDANLCCRDLDTYRDYIQSSRAEWSVAKNAYVQGRPAWFSERSACYLAAGRPVVVQDTGFGAVLPVGEGIVSFGTPQEAADAIREVHRNHARHAEAARAIASTCFDSDRVLTRLVEDATSAGDAASGSAALGEAIADAGRGVS